MDTPEVTVIIPSFNRGDTLKEAVLSVLNQSFKNLEVIVVDDCSVKPAIESLKEAARDPRFKIIAEALGDNEPGNRLHVIRQNINQGQAAARNKGAEVARGKWLAFLDDDDTFYHHKIERQLAFMREGNHRVSVTDYTLPGDYHRIKMRNSDADPEWLILTGRFLALPSTMMIEKTLFKDMGGFDPDPIVRRTEDFAFALRLYERGQPLVVMPSFLSHYSGFHAAAPEFELNALRGVKKKHGHIFSPGTRAAELFHVAMLWKETEAKANNKPLMHRALHVASLAFQYPEHAFHLADLARSVLPARFPDGPKTGHPVHSKLSYPFVPV